MKQKNEKSLIKFTEAVEKYVRPATYPVAIKMLESISEQPKDALVPSKDFKHRVAICQALALARRWGVSLAIFKNDQYCPFAAINFGFSETPDFYLSGNVALGYYAKNLTVGRKLEEGVYRFNHGKYVGLAVAPLSKANFDPDIAAIYGNGMQMMRLVNAYLWSKGGRLNNSITARAACTEIIPKTMITNECSVTIPCYGEREWAMTQDDELIFTAPIDKFMDIAKGLEGSFKNGARIISRVNLSWEAGMFSPYDELCRLIELPFTKEILEPYRNLKIPLSRSKEKRISE